MESLRNMIEGRTVALIGPAKYLQGTGYGEEIDSHDLVARINRGVGINSYL